MSSLELSPPGSGKDVAGAKAGSTASMLIERYAEGHCLMCSMIERQISLKPSSCRLRMVKQRMRFDLMNADSSWVHALTPTRMILCGSMMLVSINVRRKVSFVGDDDGFLRLG